jgi:hypothetical protein
MEGSWKTRVGSRLAKRPNLETLEVRLQLSTTATLPAPLPVSGALNGWVFKLVSKNGQDAPGSPGVSLTGGFIQPGSVSDRAQVTFGQSTNSASSAEGLFFSRLGPKNSAKFLAQPLAYSSPIVTQNQSLPGGTAKNVIGSSPINNNGQVAFAVSLTPPASAPANPKPGGVYLYKPGQKVITGIAVPQDQLPNGATFEGPSGHVSLNNRGQIAFSAFARLTSNNGLGGTNQGTGVYVTAAGNQVNAIATPGSLAADGQPIDYASDPSISDKQSMAYVAHEVGTPTYTDPTDSTRLLGGDVYTVRPGNNPAQIAHEGQTLTSQQGGGTLLYGADPIANNKGQVLFVGAINTASTLGVFQFSPNGGLKRIVGPGDTLPDNSKITTVVGGSGSIGYTDKGYIAFLADTSTGGQGVYVWRAGTIYKVAQTGDVIPGLGLGSITSFNQTGGHTSGPLLNSDSQVYFAAQTSNGDNALFVATSLRTINAKSATRK